jgi:hypothetical protein
MNRKLFILIVSCILAMGLQAETIRVLRFVPVAGAESEVAQNSLQKVVFTQDSIVLISALDGEPTPMYKYDYQSILFAESSSEGIDEVKSEEPRVKSEKFIKDGQLYIMYGGRMYDVQGRVVK